MAVQLMRIKAKIMKVRKDEGDRQKAVIILSHLTRVFELSNIFIITSANWNEKSDPTDRQNFISIAQYKEMQFSIYLQYQK